MRCLQLLLLLVPAFSSGIVLSQELSLLEKDPTGWIDLFPDKELTNWKRVALDQGLTKKSPWTVNGDLLVCLGASVATGQEIRGEVKNGEVGLSGAKEMLLYRQPFGDGVFHLEFRFHPLDGKHAYNSGAYVRSLDGKVWHQIQIAHPDTPPFIGDLFGDMQVNGKPERVIIQGSGPQHVKMPGEWNTLEITTRGNEVVVWINGHTTLTWKECSVEKGMVGMQSEFYDLEFRNLKFKPRSDP